MRSTASRESRPRSPRKVACGVTLSAGMRKSAWRISLRRASTWSSFVGAIGGRDSILFGAMLLLVLLAAAPAPVKIASLGFTTAGVDEARAEAYQSRLVSLLRADP